MAFTTASAVHMASSGVAGTIEVVTIESITMHAAIGEANLLKSDRRHVVRVAIITGRCACRGCSGGSDWCVTPPTPPTPVSHLTGCQRGGRTDFQLQRFAVNVVAGERCNIGADNRQLAGSAGIHYAVTVV